jgi:3-phosphoshikimate 1-carboxyvinyltransferase
MEPVANLRVRHRPLRGIHIPPELVPIAIDEFPAILIAAACATGTTVLTDASELRVKESDRIDAMAEGLRRLGIEVTTSRDGMTVTGGTLHGGEINSYGDHRIAMAFAIGAQRAAGEVRIRDCNNVDTSFPGFVDAGAGIGMRIDIEAGHG